jgi:hypothetical protein
MQPGGQQQLPTYDEGIAIRLVPVKFRHPSGACGVGGSEGTASWQRGSAVLTTHSGFRKLYLRPVVDTLGDGTSTGTRTFSNPRMIIERIPGAELAGACLKTP